MRRVGQARKRDANEKPIRTALEAAGATVTPISGEGAPDLLVRFSRVVGIYSLERDRTTHWLCPDCGGTWPRG
jgi:hypothetical protein